MKKLTSLLLCLLAVSLTRCYFPDVEILDSDRLFYGPDLTTLNATLTYRKLDDGKSSSSACVELFNTKSGTRIPIQSLDSGKTLINNYFETAYLNTPGAPVPGFSMQSATDA
jgi:hypothetical protein